MKNDLTKNEMIGVAVVEVYKPTRRDYDIMEYVDLVVAQNSKDPASKVGGALNKTREESAMRFVTKEELIMNMDRVIERIDRLDAKIDKLITQ